MLRRRGVNKAGDEMNTVPAVKHLFTVISFIHFSHANLKPFFSPPLFKQAEFSWEWQTGPAGKV